MQIAAKLTHYSFSLFCVRIENIFIFFCNIFSKNFTSWLMDKMTMIGLESYQQNFVVDFPQELSLLNEPISGTNVYGILRAPRMARTEALVLLTPLKSESSGPFYELVFLLSLAEHFRSKSILVYKFFIIYRRKMLLIN